MNFKNKTPGQLLTIFSPIISGLAFCLSYHSLVIDDSFVLYRYGKNLIDFGVWNYNPSQLQLDEAYTSLVGAGISIIPALLKMDPKWFTVLVNALVLGLIIFQLKKKAFQNTSLILWLLLGNALLFVHFFSGMETFLFMLVLFTLFWKILKDEESEWIPAISLMLFLIRPDGVIFSLYGFFISFTKGRRGKFYSVLCIMSIAVYWILRTWYFEQLFPNPIHIKSLQGFKPGIFISNLFQAKFYIVFLAALVFFLQEKKLRILALLALGTLIFLYAPSRLMMNYGDRFFFQISFPLFALSVILIPIKRKILISSILFFNVYSLVPFQYNPLLTYGQRLQYSYVDLGKRLAPFQGHTMVTGEGGSLPYYSSWRNFDPLGLGTRRGSEGQIDFLEIANPDLVFFYENEEGMLELIPGVGKSNDVDNWLKENGFYKVSACWFSPDYRIHSFLKSGVEDEEKIKSALIENEEYSKQSITKFQKWFYGLFH